MSIIRSTSTGLFCCLLWLNAFAANVEPESVRELAVRRARVMDKMGGQGILILFSGDQKNFSNDVHYPFRQENNLFYLTGINQQGITLVLVPENTKQREILFLPKPIPSQEVWTGHKLSHEEARAISGIENIWHADEFERYLDAVLYKRRYRLNQTTYPDEYQNLFKAIDQGMADVWLLLGSRPGLKGPLSREHEFANTLRERFPGVRTKDALSIFRDLRLIKSAYELRQLQRAIEITCEAHRKALQTVNPGIYEYQIDGLIHATYRSHGAHWGFPSIVGSGPNATTLHYIEHTRQMHDGELVLLDIGAEVGHYSADVTRTLPVNGRFTEAQREIYTLVLHAQQEAMAAIRPGATIPDVNKAAQGVLKTGLKRLGLITETAGDQYRIWFMHGTSHWIGLDVHDVGDRNTVFQPGMVLTVEPGIYIREDALDHLDSQTDQQFKDAIRPAFERYKNIGIRIEDDVMVTEDGFEVLSTAPKSIEEIERLMNHR